jgi:uncharacterized protein YcfJ
MKNLILIATICLLSVGCSSSPYKTVKVDVKGYIKSSQVAPELCYKKSDGSGGKTFLGAVVGAAIGNQFGSGNGRKLATVAGGLVGAGIASSSVKGNRNKYNCYSDGYENQVAFLNPFSRQMEYKLIKTDRRKSVGTYIIFEHKESLLRDTNS